MYLVPPSTYDLGEPTLSASWTILNGCPDFQGYCDVVFFYHLPINGSRKIVPTDNDWYDYDGPYADMTNIYFGACTPLITPTQTTTPTLTPTNTKTPTVTPSFTPTSTKFATEVSDDADNYFTPTPTKTPFSTPTTTPTITPTEVAPYTPRTYTAGNNARGGGRGGTHYQFGGEWYGNESTLLYNLTSYADMTLGSLSVVQTYPYFPSVDTNGAWSLALDNNGQVYVAGSDNAAGGDPMGTGTPDVYPLKTFPYFTITSSMKGKKFIKISVGSTHCLAISAGGNNKNYIFGTGINSFGQLDTIASGLGWRILSAFNNPIDIIASGYTSYVRDTTAGASPSATWYVGGYQSADNPFWNPGNYTLGLGAGITTASTWSPIISGHMWETLQIGSKNYPITYNYRTFRNFARRIGTDEWYAIGTKDGAMGDDIFGSRTQGWPDEWMGGSTWTRVFTGGNYSDLKYTTITFVKSANTKNWFVMGLNDYGKSGIGSDLNTVPLLTSVPGEYDDIYPGSTTTFAISNNLLFAAGGGNEALGMGYLWYTNSLVFTGFNITSPYNKNKQVWAWAMNVGNNSIANAIKPTPTGTPTTTPTQTQTQTLGTLTPTPTQTLTPTIGINYISDDADFYITPTPTPSSPKDLLVEVCWDLTNVTITGYDPYPSNENDIPRINLFTTTSGNIYMSAGRDVLYPAIPPNSISNPWGDRSIGSYSVYVANTGLFIPGVDIFVDSSKTVDLIPPLSAWTITEQGNDITKYQHLFIDATETVKVGINNRAKCPNETPTQTPVPTQTPTSTQLPGYFGTGIGTDFGMGNTFYNTFTNISGWDYGWPIVNLKTNGSFTIAIDKYGSLYGTGRNNLGQLGIGNTTDQRYFQREVRWGTWSTNPDHLALGDSFFVVMSGAGNNIIYGETYKLFGAGNNQNGELGVNTGSYSTILTAIPGNWSKVKAFGGRVFALSAGTNIWYQGGLLIAPSARGFNFDTLNTGWVQISGVNGINSSSPNFSDIKGNLSVVYAKSANTNKWFGAGAMLGLGSESNNLAISKNFFTELSGDWGQVSIGRSHGFLISSINPLSSVYAIGDNRYNQFGLTILPYATGYNSFTILPHLVTSAWAFYDSSFVLSGGRLASCGWPSGLGIGSALVSQLCGFSAVITPPYFTEESDDLLGGNAFSNVGRFIRSIIPSSTPFPTPTPTPEPRKAIFTAYTTPLTFVFNGVSFNIAEAGTNNPTITCFRYQNYDIVAAYVGSNNVALRLSPENTTQSVSGTYNNDLVNGINYDIILFTPTSATPNQIVYVSTLNAEISGIIIIKDRSL